MSIINKLNKGTTKQSLVPKIIQRWWIDCEWNYSFISNKKHEKGITNSGVKSNKVWWGGDRFDIKRSKKIGVEVWYNRCLAFLYF